MAVDGRLADPSTDTDWLQTGQIGTVVLGPLVTATKPARRQRVALIEQLSPAPVSGTTSYGGRTGSDTRTDPTVGCWTLLGTMTHSRDSNSASASSIKVSWMIRAHLPVYLISGSQCLAASRSSPSRVK